MPTREQVRRDLDISALNQASAEARAWLDSPRPAPGASDAYARSWFAAWARILLLDLGTLGTNVTREGAAEILGTDVMMIATVLDQLRRADDEEPPLSDADFARITQAH